MRRASCLLFRRAVSSGSFAHRSFPSTLSPSLRGPLPRPPCSPALPPLCRSFASSLSAAVEEWKEFNSAGLRYLDAGEFDRAEAMFISALRTSQAMARTGSTTSASSVPLYLAMSNLSAAQRNQGKLQESEQNALSALQAVLALGSALSPDVAAHLHREMGLAQELQGKWEAAKEHFDASQRLYQQRIDHLHAQQKGTDPASPAASSSALAASSTSSSSAVSPSDSLPDLHQQRANALYGLGLAHEKLNDSPSALSSYRAASECAEVGYGASSVNAAEAHVAVGRLLVEEAEKTGDEGKKASLQERGGEELMKALDIYRAHEHPKLLEVLSLYMRSLGLSDQDVDDILGDTSPAR